MTSKYKREGVKGEDLQTKLICYQLKMGHFIYVTSYASFMVSTKPRTRTDAQKIKKGETQNTIRENYQFIEVGREKEIMEI